MYHYLSIMIMICTVYLMLPNDAAHQKKLDDFWRWLKQEHRPVYRHMRYNSANAVFLLDGRVSRRFLLYCYRRIRKKYKFN